MARIAIYIGRHLCTAPRPVKEADALAAAGFEVSVHGLWFDSRLVERDENLVRGRRWRFEPYADARVDSARGRRLWFRLRAKHRFARALFTYGRTTTADAFGYGTTRLLSHATKAAADLTIVHSEGGLWAAHRLRGVGFRVGVDFEDWFSQDLPLESRRGRPIGALAMLEAAALRSGPYVLTTSHALARALADAYSGPEPAVIYNTFPAAGMPARSHAVNPNRISLHWFSQTLGSGRGLETLFTTLPHLPPCWQLHLIAEDPDRYGAKLISGLPEALRDRVRIEPTVPNADLPTRIAEHDIGLALDLSTVPSRNLTITNKLFQYLHAGLAVVASDTAGHREVLDQVPAAGVVYRASDSEALVEALRQLCSDPTRIEKAKRCAREAAAGLFSHERQIPRYATLVTEALQAD